MQEPSRRRTRSDAPPMPAQTTTTRNQTATQSWWKSRRQRQQARTTDNNATAAEELSRHLQAASEDLLNRLFCHLSDQDGTDPHQIAAGQAVGLTLPAAAVGWLASQLFPHQNNHHHAAAAVDESFLDRSGDSGSVLSVSMRDRLSLLKYLLPRATRLRVTNETWPPTRRRRRKMTRRRRQQQEEEQQPDISTLTWEEGMPQSFLEFYDALVHRPRVDMRVFSNCKVLWIDQVPTEWIVHLQAVRKTLQVLRVERSLIGNMGRLLGDLHARHEQEREEEDPLSLPVSDDLDQFPVLTHVRFTQCSLNEESGLQGGPVVAEGNDQGKQVPPPPLSHFCRVQALSLAHNELQTEQTALAGLSAMPWLTKLDLAYNQLTSLSQAHYQLGNLQTLRLSHNQLERVEGIDRLLALENLYLDHNRIARVDDMSSLARLPQLRSLTLQGNPLCRAYKTSKAYRLAILALFRDQRLSQLTARATLLDFKNDALVVLDQQAPSMPELLSLRKRAFRPTTTQLVVSVLQVEPQATVTTTTQSVGISVAPTTTRSAVPHRRRPRQRVALIQTDQRERLVPVERRPFQGQPRAISFTLQDVLESLPDFVGKQEPDVVEESIVEQEEEKVMDNVAESGVETEDEENQNNQNVSLDLVDDSQKDAVEVVSTRPDENHEIVVSGGDASENNEADKETPPTPLSASKKENSDFSMSGAAGDMNEWADKWRAEDGSLTLSPIRAGGTDHLKNSEATTAAETQPESDPKESEANEKEAAGSTQGAENAAAVLTPRPSPATSKSLGLNRERQVSEVSKASKAESSVSQVHLPFPVVTFPENIWNSSDDNASVPSSIGTSPRPPVEDKFQLAEQKSTYNGPKPYATLRIHENLELYFQVFVFPEPPDVLPSPAASIQLADDEEEEDWQAVLEKYPRIQLWPIDRRPVTRSEPVPFGVTETPEVLRRVWKESVIACGKLASKRVAPYLVPRYGFHGELLWSDAKSSHLKPDAYSDSRRVILCCSNKAFYIILDNDSLALKARDQKRKFPLPIPDHANFEDAQWPHALARHPFETLEAITIGFSFQRLTLRFSSRIPGDDFVYILLTSNKMETVSLLKEIQERVSEARSVTGGLFYNEEAHPLQIENDDPHVLDALSAAVAPDIVDIVLHYQVLQQKWKHGDRGSVRRVCVVTDTKAYLLDEDYVQDGSESQVGNSQSTAGQTVYRLVDSTDLVQIAHVLGADADPVSITIVIKPISRLQRTRNWRLVTRDRHGAERLVEDVRKAVSTRTRLLS